MKTLKVKSILFSLLAIMAVVVFMTSCEQTASTLEDEIIDMNVQEDAIVFSIEDLPESPEEVLANSMLENTNQELESRLSCNKVIRLKEGVVDWRGPKTLALWIYHYNSSGNYIGYTRRDRTSSGGHYDCTVWDCKTWPYNNSIAKSVAFVGYQSNGTLTKIW